MTTVITDLNKGGVDGWTGFVRLRVGFGYDGLLKIMQ